jgi:hypothetical protein
VLTGKDLEGRNRTIILWREVDLVGGNVVHWGNGDHHPVLTVLEAVEVAQATLAAARVSATPGAFEVMDLVDGPSSPCS